MIKAQPIYDKKKKKPMTRARAINKGKAFLIGLARYLLIICLSYLILAPILKNITVALTDPRDLNFPSSMWVPARISIENLHVSYIMLDYSRALLYTIFNTAAITILQTISAMMAGYTFARLKFPGRELLFGIVVFTIIVPPQMFMFPQYLYFKEFNPFGLIKLLTGKTGLLNTPVALYILNALGMGLKSGLYIYIFRQTFRGLPKELEEAAYIDGAGFIHTFTRIVLPAAGAGILTVVVLSYVWNWNDPYYAQLFDNKNVLNLMLAFNRAVGSVDESLTRISSRVPVEYAFITKSPVYENAIAKTAALLVFLPLVFLYMLIQRKFVQGVERSGIVG